MAGARKQDRGIALIAVLWVMTLLSLLAASFSGSSRTQADLARNAFENARAEAAADAGLFRAIAALMAPIEEANIRVDGTAYGWAFADAQIRFYAEDEGGKVDLNAAPIELLSALFQAVGAEPDLGDALAQRIVDFREGDDGSSAAGGRRAPNPAEDEEGDEDGAAVFRLVEELQQVPGITGEVYRRVASLVTVFANEPEPRIEVAPPDVQEAMTILAERATGAPPGRDRAEATSGREGTRPSQPDEDAEGGDRADFGDIDRGGQLNPRSGVNIFTVHVEAQTLSGAVFVREAVVAPEPGAEPPYRVLDWRRGRPALFPSGPGDEG
jgi:general secretion pathway protein K